MSRRAVLDAAGGYRIREVADRRAHLPLLLLADEQPEMLARYLDRGLMFALEREGEVLAVCIVTDEGGGLLELKNIAVAPAHQRQGYGRRLVEFLFDRFAGQFDTIEVGTGDSPLTVPFYESLGFVRSRVIEGFFTENYDHPNVEGGVVLRDMVVLRRPLGEGPLGERYRP